MTRTYTPGSLVTARGREWVVLPDSEPDLLVLRPLGGSDDDISAVFPTFEEVRDAQFAPPRRTTSATSGQPGCCAPPCASASAPVPAPSAPSRASRSNPVPTNWSPC